MDATLKLTALTVTLLIAFVGCYPLNEKPEARPEKPVPAETRSTSQVVQAPPPAQEPDEAGGVDRLVQGYIQQVDDVGRRAARPAELAAAQSPASPSVHTRTVPGDSNDGLPPGPAEGPPGVAVAPGAALAAGADGSGAVRAPTAGSSTGSETGASPPALSAVSARSDSTPLRPELRDEPKSPAVNATASAHRAPATLRELLSQWPEEGDQVPFARQLDRRMLFVLAGDYEGARQPLAGVSAEQQEIALRFVESLITIREEHDGDPAGAASRIAAELGKLAETLRAHSSLRIPALVICQEVSGYGAYRPIEPAVFPIGVPSEFVLYCEVADFVRELRDDGLYHSRFELRTRVLNGGGEAVLDIRDADIEDRCRQPRHDCFIPRLVRLPQTLSPGEYVAKITIVDKLGGKVAEGRATFRVQTGP